MRVYSDGSAIDGGVEGAAVLMKNGEMVKERRFHLGSDQEHMVYEGEIIGMILAVEILREERKGTMSLGVDNQAVICATKVFVSKPGHYLMDKFHDDLRSLILAHDNQKLIIQWALDHKGIPGNEAADEQAKRAARGESSILKELPKSLLATRSNNKLTLPISKSALKQIFRGEIKTKAATIMKNSPHYQHLHNIDETAPSKHFSMLVEKLPQQHSSLLFQLCTGHAPLNKHLHWIMKVPSPTCQQCHHSKETVHYFLLICPKYTRQRLALQNEIGSQASHLKNLLSNRKCIKPLLHFIAGTHRLEQMFGDVNPPTDDEEDEADK